MNSLSRTGVTSLTPEAHATHAPDVLGGHDPETKLVLTAAREVLTELGHFGNYRIKCGIAEWKRYEVFHSGIEIVEDEWGAEVELKIEETHMLARALRRPLAEIAPNGVLLHRFDSVTIDLGSHSIWY